MTVCRLSIKIHFFVNSIKFPPLRCDARLSCDDKVKNAENLPVMFLIFRKTLKLTNKMEEEKLLGGRCHGVRGISVVRVSRAKNAK